jgi:hypothetical protein
VQVARLVQAQLQVPEARPASASVHRRLEASMTRSPFLIATDFTTPAAVDGTSMVAFSVSSVISGVSTSILSPAFTSTSMTSTSLKSPRSGMVMSCAMAAFTA